MITEDNFTEFFHKAGSNYKPLKGQVLARFCCMADLVDGEIKKSIIDYVAKNSEKHFEMAGRILTRIINCSEKDSERVLNEIKSDLSKIDIDKVYEKPYRFMLEQLYWTKMEHIPVSPNWSLVDVVYGTDYNIDFDIPEDTTAKKQSQIRINFNEGE